MTTLKPADWQERGEGMMTPKQQRMLNAICGDLAAGLSWHGQRLTKDDWRHMVAGTMLRWRLMPTIDRGQGGAHHARRIQPEAHQVTGLRRHHRAGADRRAPGRAGHACPACSLVGHGAAWAGL